MATINDFTIDVEARKKQLLDLNNNLNILLEREAKYGGNAPLDLLNQIDDHREAIDLVEEALDGDLTSNELDEALKPLLLAFHQGQVVNITAETYVAGDQIIHNYYQSPEGEPVEVQPLSFEPETVLIEAGPFVMGSNEGKPQESPQHTVELSEYRIGKYPVTNRQYVEFIRQTGRVVETALLWDGNQPPKDKLNHPVTGVTWYEALEYCQWLSKQTRRKYTLPSEAQWEKAARGIDGRLYPWGNKWEPDRCNLNSEELVLVDAFPEQNEYGCSDLIGNAREWTSTLWGTSRQTPDPEFRYHWKNDGRDNLTAPKTTRRVYRGGTAEDIADFRCSTRGGYLPEKPGPKRNRHGFRVVLLPATNISVEVS